MLVGQRFDEPLQVTASEHKLDNSSEHSGIDRARLGQYARGPRKVAGLSRIAHGDRQSSRLQGSGDNNSIATRSFLHNQADGRSLQACRQAIAAFDGAGKRLRRYYP